jgi:aminopeptidase N
MSRAALATVLFALCSACQVMQSMLSRRTLPHDPHSYAEPNRVRVRHVSLELALDFQRRCAEGSARLDLERTERSAPLKLDVRALDVLGVTGSAGGKRKFLVGREHPSLGSALTIELADGDESVTVHYKTAPSAQAMQWLEPAQTRGGNHPFLFTQGQAILTRTWIPLQDSPAVRVTYDATIRAPKELTAVMSAEQLGRGADGAWRFRMQQPIPSYLIALACGELEFRAISPRCGVWAEPSLVARAHAELGDTEAMIASAEGLFGPYRWERYDLIVLPPSFPFGGMENPRLTFATPTILAGDRSLVGLVAHELAHSWSGNLVTNATWRDFWLNEGFTVYFEQRIMEQVYGTERSNMEKFLGLREYEEELPTLDAGLRVLHPDLAGRDPDDAVTSVPYQKGALFLRRVEELVGRRSFDVFLRRWFDEHAFMSVTTAEFLEYLQRELGREHKDALAQLDVQRWMYDGGIPEDLPRPTSTLLASVDAALGAWRGGARPEDLATRGWTTQQWLRFLDALPEEMTVEQLAALDRAFGLTQSENSEILCEWLVKCVRNRYSAADSRVVEFLSSVGRRKFLKPIYTELAKSPEGLRRAREIYAVARPRYHAVATRTIDELLGWKS